RRLEETLAAVLAERRKRVTAPVIILTPGGLSQTMEEVHRGNGVAIFHDIASCFESLKAYDAAVNRAPIAADVRAPAASGRATEVTRLLEAARQAGRTLLTEIESADILRAQGVPMVESHVVRSANEAVAAAPGYPVVLKALAPGVAHKNDRGLVVA